MALNFANNNSLSAITTKPSGLSGGALNLISTQTASSSSTISFTSGIDSTYDEYVFKFYDIHVSNVENKEMGFQCSTDGGSSYGVTATTTLFQGVRGESGSPGSVSYNTGNDLAQSTNFQPLMLNLDNADDSSHSGQLTIFSPSSDTFVKHFIADGTNMFFNDGAGRQFVAGYFNTTSPLNAVQFKFNSGNIDSGVIKLYGIS